MILGYFVDSGTVAVVMLVVAVLRVSVVIRETQSYAR